MPLTPAIACTAVGLVLLAFPWPAPMAGLAFVMCGAVLGVGAARGRRA